MENIKEFIEKAVAKIKESPDLLKKFKEDPKGTIKEIIGEFDDDIISGVVEAVKAKLGDSDLLDGLKDKIGGLFGKKD